jgi:tRNA dimethylallyltransferase
MAHRAAPPAILLMGPTASGKTDLALALAERLPCDVVSVDSTQVYRGMDIGTAKPGPEVLRRVPHRLIDLRDPAEPYSAADFRRDALREMAAIVAAGRIPLLVGGSMLYFRALIRGLSELPRADGELRGRLEAEAGRLGWPALHARLARIDPNLAARIHPNDAQRIQRALEVHTLTGRPPSELFAASSGPIFPYRGIVLVLAAAGRARLHARIAARFDAMLAQGMVGEVEVLYNRNDLNLDRPALRAVGYRQVWEYFAGRTDFATMKERALAATRQLARRQLTWLRGERDGCWLDGEDPQTMAKAIRYVTAHIEPTGSAMRSPLSGAPVGRPSEKQQERP